MTVEGGIPQPPVTVYWRPGCAYCARLRRGLSRAGIATAEVNIWAEPDAAAIVRGIATGNETVPTVVVGDVSLVNPSTAEVRQALLQIAPDLTLVEPGAAPPFRWMHGGSRRSRDASD